MLILEVGVNVNVNVNVMVMKMVGGGTLKRGQNGVKSRVMMMMMMIILVISTFWTSFLSSSPAFISIFNI